MKLPVVLHRFAMADVASTYLKYEGVRAGLGRRFNKYFREILSRIALMPEIYAFHWRHVRAARIRKVRQVVYYVAYPTRVEVIAVVHGAKDPSFWQTRIIDDES